MRNLFILLSFSCCLILNAQFSFKGKIESEANKQPIQFAEIVLVNDTIELSNLSDETGNFVFENLEKGTYDLIFLENFDTIYSEKIDLTSDLMKTFSIKREEVQLDEVVVTKKLFQKKADRFIFDVANSPISKGNDAFNLLKQTPLVSSTDNQTLKILGKSDVIIYINGRKTNMDNEAIIELLKNTPSEDIQKIEVITVPGSEFQVEANVGVVNIVMKKSSTNGFNGNVRLVDNQGYYNSPRANVGLNYRKDKLAVTSGAYVGRYKSREKNLLSNGNENYTNISDGVVDDPNTNVGGNINVDYELAKNQNIGLTYNFRYNKSFDSTFDLFNSYNGVLANRTLKTEDSQSRNHSLNLNYELRTDSLGSKLMTNVSYLRYNRNMESKNETFPFDDSQYQSFYQHVPQIINNLGINADYILKTKQENTWLFGVNYTYTKTDNDTKQDNLINGIYVPDEVLTNHFMYKENILGLYLTFEAQLSEKLSGKIGTRFEMTKTDGDIIGKDNSFTNDYNNLLPYLSLNYAINPNHNLSYAFSSRIRRPAFWELNPSRTYMTPTNYIQNNPFMISSKHYNQEFTYLYKGAYFLNVSFEYIDDANSQLPLQGVVRNTSTDEETEFLRYIRMNYGNKKTLNIALGMNKSFFDGIWNANYMATLMYQNYRGTVTEDPTYIPQQGLEETLYTYIVDRESTNAYFKFDNTIRLSSKKDWFLGVNYWHLTPFELELGKLGRLQSLDLNIKKIWNNWVFMLEAEDILNSRIQKIDGQQANGNFNNVWQQQYNRQLTLSVTYNFGNQKLKKARNVEEANSAIKSRL